MPTILKEVKLIMADVTNNNNKFWTGKLLDNGSVELNWGRVGKKEQSKTKDFGSQYQAEHFLETKQREKERKGYKSLRVAGKVETKTVADNRELKTIAKEQIKSKSTVVSKLIDYLTDKNAHQITSATGGQITLNANGLFQTPLGIITQDAIDEANDVLVGIGDLVTAGDYGRKMDRKANDYLMLVPQDIGMKRLNTSNFFKDLVEVQKQKAIVDALQASLVTAQSTPDDGKDKVVKEQVFDVKMEHVRDAKIIDKIKKKYGQTQSSRHSCSHLKVKKVYSVEIKMEKEAFENYGRPIGNIMELWHGTRVSNVLAILKAGLVIPPSSASNVTGRMFGDGLYFSDQSTKSLNYAYGYWGGGSKDNNCFMFLSDVAMGKPHHPSNSGRNFPKAGSDSTFAKAGSCVMNNEMIVYDPAQVSLKYLIEFA
jgi:poly [ADP-ribose] polymerase